MEVDDQTKRGGFNKGEPEQRGGIREVRHLRSHTEGLKRRKLNKPQTVGGS